MREDRPETVQEVSRTSRLRRIAEHRHFPLMVTVLGVILVLPSLGAGLFIDDYHHRLLMTDSQSPARLLKSPLDMFRFLDGDPERAQYLKDLGLYPWWITDKAKAAFWRPVTSLTHWLDYLLWPDAPTLMHAQSILWYGLLVLAVTFLYRRIAPTAAVAAIAALLFACDGVHAIPVGFLANRNAVIAATFGVLALIAHDRYRRDQSKPALFGAVALFTASLLAAEAGIATMAYLGAYVLCIDRAGWKSRIGSMIPYLAVIVVWRLIWDRLGYGVEHLGVYVDPLGTPLRYLGAVKDRAPILLLAQFLGPPRRNHDAAEALGHQSPLAGSAALPGPFHRPADSSAAPGSHHSLLAGRHGVLDPAGLRHVSFRSSANLHQHRCRRPVGPVPHRNLRFHLAPSRPTPASLRRAVTGLAIRPGSCDRRALHHDAPRGHSHGAAPAHRADGTRPAGPRRREAGCDRGQSPTGLPHKHQCPDLGQ